MAGRFLRFSLEPSTWLAGKSIRKGAPVEIDWDFLAQQQRRSTQIGRKYASPLKPRNRLCVKACQGRFLAMQ